MSLRTVVDPRPQMGHISSYLHTTTKRYATLKHRVEGEGGPAGGNRRVRSQFRQNVDSDHSLTLPLSLPERVCVCPTPSPPRSLAPFFSQSPSLPPHRHTRRHPEPSRRLAVCPTVRPTVRVHPSIERASERATGGY